MNSMCCFESDISYIQYWIVDLACDIEASNLLSVQHDSTCLYFSFCTGSVRLSSLSCFLTPSQPGQTRNSIVPAYSNSVFLDLVSTVHYEYSIPFGRHTVMQNVENLTLPCFGFFNCSYRMAWQVFEAQRLPIGQWLLDQVLVDTIFTGAWWSTDFVASFVPVSGTLWFPSWAYSLSQYIFCIRVEHYKRMHICRRPVSSPKLQREEREPESEEGGETRQMSCCYTISRR